MAEKKTGVKKKSWWWLIVLIVIIILALILVFSTKGCNNSNENQEINDTEEPNPDTGEPGTENPTGGSGSPEQPKVYKTSDKLTEILLTRDVSGQGISQKASFKINGYLQEVDPFLDEDTQYSERAYILKDGTMEWSLDEDYEYGSFIETITSSGKDLISSLNVYWDNGNPTPLTTNDIYKLKLVYNEHGLNEQGKSEFKTVGNGLLIPINQTENGIKNVQTGIIRIPIKFLGLNPDTQKTFANSFVAKEPYENEWKGTILSGYQDAIFAEMALVTVTDIPVLGNLGPWQVSWNIEFP